MKKKNPDTFGGRVAALREAIKPRMSQTALAEKVGISQPSLSDIENNETTFTHIKAKTLERLVMHLRTNSRYLSSGEGSPGPDTGDALKKITAVFPHLTEEQRGELAGYAEALYAQKLAKSRKEHA